LELNHHNSSYNYTNTCNTCHIPVGDATTNDQFTFAIITYIGLGYALLTIQSLINFSLDNRRLKVLKYSGASDKFNVPEMLKTMEAADAEARVEEDADLQLDDDMIPGDKRLDMAHMIHFPGGQKTALDVLSLHTYDMIMWWTKFVNLMNCFYVGFWACHMSFIVHKTTFNFVDDMLGTSIGPIFVHMFVHSMILLPSTVIVVYAVPITVRNLALLSGVLFLNDDAVNDTMLHIERMSGIRERITNRLLKTSFLKGKAKVGKGRALLQLLIEGELKMLQHLTEISDDARISHRQMMDIMDKQPCHTTDAALSEFMDRNEFAEFLKESPEDQATAQTAKTLQIAPEGGNFRDDTITCREFTIFLLRAVADASNIAAEHGVPKADLSTIEDQCVNLATISTEDFIAARLLARTRSMFRTVDKDCSGTIDKPELWKAIRKYRIPITSDDLETIMRVLDPDQSGQISLQEWVDFMLATADNFERKTTDTEARIRELNAEQGFMDDLVSFGESVITETRDGITGTVTGTIEGALLVTGDVLTPFGGEKLLQPVHSGFQKAGILSPSKAPPNRFLTDDDDDDDDGIPDGPVQHRGRHPGDNPDEENTDNPLVVSMLGDTPARPADEKQTVV